MYCLQYGLDIDTDEINDYYTQYVMQDFGKLSCHQCTLPPCTSKAMTISTIKVLDMY